MKDLDIVVTTISGTTLRLDTGDIWALDFRWSTPPDRCGVEVTLLQDSLSFNQAKQLRDRLDAWVKHAERRQGQSREMESPL